MSGLKDKKIILGVCGSIAAYKSAYLTRLLVKAGAEVRVITTDSAESFVSALTFSTLSRNQVYSDLSTEGNWENHVELGLWADAMIVAPITANSMAHMAHGIADNMLVATYLSARCPVYIAPAMDLDMWKHDSTRRNLKLLQESGVRLIDVAEGELASGLSGPGRMAEPEDIASRLEHELGAGGKLSKKKILITAGPTYEPIDPVRFIGNRSSGKMGLALARAGLAMGAEVELIMGPGTVDVPAQNKLTVTRVETAAEMKQHALRAFEKSDAAIMAAAVSDYRAARTQSEKIKKSDDKLTLELAPTPDIAAELSKVKKERKLIGFALETENEKTNAKKKLRKKDFDFIVLNSLKDQGAGFGHDTNKVSIFHRDGSSIEYELKSKQAVAFDILEELSKLFEND